MTNCVNRRYIHNFHWINTLALALENSIYPWHIKNWEYLVRLESKLPHALLFYGPSGTGVEIFAESFAKARLCENRQPDGHACGECQSCHWFKQYSHPDFRPILPETLEIARGIDDQDQKTDDDSGSAEKKAKEPSKKIGIERIRSLIDFINISTHRGGLRIVSIYPAEAMTTESSNSVLKMLEEPPANTLFILVTNHLDALLPTIVSRCSKLAFPMPETSAAIRWLTGQGVNDAESWLAEQGGAPVTALAESQSGSREEMGLFLAELAAPDDSSLLKTAEKLQKVPLTDLITWQQRWLYDLLSLRLTGKGRYYPKYREQLSVMESRMNLDMLLEIIKTVNDRKRVADHPLVPRLVLEDMLLDYRKIFSQ